MAMTGMSFVCLLSAKEMTTFWAVSRETYYGQNGSVLSTLPLSGEMRELGLLCFSNDQLLRLAIILTLIGFALTLIFQTKKP